MDTKYTTSMVANKKVIAEVLYQDETWKIVLNPSTSAGYQSKFVAYQRVKAAGREFLVVLPAVVTIVAYGQCKAQVFEDEGVDFLNAVRKAAEGSKQAWFERGKAIAETHSLLGFVAFLMENVWQFLDKGIQQKLLEVLHQHQFFQVHPEDAISRMNDILIRAYQSMKPTCTNANALETAEMMYAEQRYGAAIKTLGECK